MLTSREEQILQFIENEIDKSTNEMVDYLNDCFTDEQRNEHGDNLINMLVRKSITTEIKMNILAEIIK